MDEQVSSLIANNPAATEEPMQDDMRQRLDEQMKLELLRDLSIEDIRNLVTMAKSGASYGREAPDTFDEYGRNFHRMVRKVQRVAPGGHEYWEEVPFTTTLKDAQNAKTRLDYFDPMQKVWYIRGRKRSEDYPENTVGYWDRQSELIGAKA